MSRRNKEDYVRTEFYDPQLMGKLEYSNNPTRNRTRQIERFYIIHLTQMCANRFTWTGLPKEIDERYLEMCLTRKGLAVFFKEEKVYNEYMVLQAGSLGPLNVYDNPTSYQVLGGSGEFRVNQKLTNEDCVPIWANYMRVSEMPNIMMWAKRLAEIDRTIEISAMNARQTKMVSVPEDQRLSAVNVLKQVNEGVEVVFGTETLGDILKAIETIDLESHPAKLPNLLISKGKIWNEIMTFMGVSNSNEDKKERLVADEVHIKDEQIDLIKAMNLSSREQAAEQINEMFGLDVSVEFNQTADADIKAGAEMAMANKVPNDSEATTWGN